MNYKSVILTIIAVAAILLLYSIPSYTEWYKKKILTVSNIPEQCQHLDPEERRELRYGYPYKVFREMAQKISDRPNVTILLPPDGYLEAMRVPDLKMVEPACFYYFTGVNAVTVKSPQVWSANWALVTEGYGHLSLKRMESRKQLDTILAVFRQYQQ